MVVVDDRIIHSVSLEDFSREHNIEIEGKGSAKEKDTLKGSVAHKGKIKGIVKVVFEFNQIDKVGEGDVLVSPMTTPDFFPAMKKAVAIVTDEGGITCHAAIIARELKKSCIIGTKVATQVLKDGMEVEVDADEGVVRIIDFHS